MDESVIKFMVMHRTHPNTEDTVLELAEEFVERCRMGESPSIAEYIERHPELADEIREVFPMVADMEEFALANHRHHSAPVSSSNGRPPWERLGDFRLIREIGRGGMGVVYEAEQISLGRRVALKVLSSDRLANEKHRERFEREARAVANLHHTNIVPIFGIGKENGTLYFAMQLIDGRPLNEFNGTRSSDLPTMASGRREPADGGDDNADNDGGGFDMANEPCSLSVSNQKANASHSPNDRCCLIARIGAQAADALHHAHMHGILHRDVKPANLLLDRHGDAWVTDFGLAKTEDSDLTEQGDVIGTIRYLAPESLSGVADARGDVYSLGLTVYELLAKAPAFPTADRGQLIRRIAAGEKLPLRKLVPNVPRDLATIVEKACACEPADRYQTAGELAADLRRFVDDEPIWARRLSAPERLARWARRNRSVAALVVTICILLCGVAIGSTIAAIHFYRLKEDQRRLAGRNESLAGENEQKRRAAEAALAEAETANRAAKTALDQAQTAHRESRRSLADMYRDHGLRAEEDGDTHLAALWFAEAARLAEGFDPRRRRMNAVRALNALKFCPWPVAALDQSDVGVDRLIFHPCNRWLIASTANKEQRPVLWNLERQSRHCFAKELGTVTAMAWSPDGRQIAVGTQSGEVFSLLFPSFEIAHRIELASSVSMTADKRVWEICYSHDGSRLAAARGDRLFIWSLPEFDRSGSSAELSGQCLSLMFSPNGQWVVAACADNVCRAFRADSLKAPEVETSHLPRANGWTLCRPVFDSSGRLVTWDHGVVWTDLNTHQRQMQRVPGNAFQLIDVPEIEKVYVTVNGAPHGYLCSPAEPVQSVNGADYLAAVRFPDTGRLVAAGSKSQLQRFDPEHGTFRPFAMFQPAGFRAMAASPDGHFFASADYDSRIRVWQWPRRFPVSVTIPTKSASSCGFPSGDSEHVLVRRTHRNAQVYRPGTGEAVGPELVPAGKLLEAAWSPDGNSVITLAAAKGHVGSLIDVWDWRSGKRDRPSIQIEVAPAGTMNMERDALAVHPEGDRAAFIAAGGSVVVIDFRERPKWHVIEGLHADNIWARGDSTDLIITISTTSHDVDVFGWNDTAPRASISVPNARKVRLSRDGRLLAISTSSALVFADATTLTPLSKPIPHPSWVTVRSIGGGGKLAAAICRDEILRIWDAETGKLAGPAIEETTDQAAVTPDGQLVIVPRAEGTCRVYDVATGRQLCPAFALPQKANWAVYGDRRIRVSPDSRFAVIGGYPMLSVVDLGLLLPTVPDDLDRLILAGELVSGHRFENGSPIAITAAEWEQRWDDRARIDFIPAPRLTSP